MDFSSALSQVRAGKKIARKGWNGMGIVVFQITAWSAIIDGKMVVNELNPFLALKTAQGTIGPWAPTHVDVLADDWYVVDETPKAVTVG